MAAEKEMRPGEVSLHFDPDTTADDARVVFIGRAVTAWQSRADCPKNMNRAKESGAPAAVHVFAPFRLGLTGVRPGDPVWIMTWMDKATRNLVVQAPAHRSEPCGVFSIRSPARPNPIGLSRAIVTAIDSETGHVDLDALDCLDGTPVIDIKPHIAAVDAD